MIQIALYSDDRKLHQLLSSALGKEFAIRLEPNEIEVARLVSAGECDVAVLDLDSNVPALEGRIEGSRSIVEAQVPVVVLASFEVPPHVRIVEARPHGEHCQDGQQRHQHRRERKDASQNRIVCPVSGRLSDRRGCAQAVPI